MKTLILLISGLILLFIVIEIIYAKIQEHTDEHETRTYSPRVPEKREDRHPRLY